MTNRSRQTASDRPTRITQSVNIECVTEGVLAIFDTAEILNLIDDGNTLDIYISRPLIQPIEDSIDTLQKADCEFDLSLPKNSKTEQRLKKHLSKTKVTESLNYDLEVLNGIHRQTDSKTGYETCFEERCYLITDSSRSPWIVTVRNRCSADMMPMIVDYDQSHNLEETRYDNQIRTIRDRKDSSLRYDVIGGVDASIVTNGTGDDVYDAVIQIVEKLNRTYESIFE